MNSDIDKPKNHKRYTQDLADAKVSLFAGDLNKMREIDAKFRDYDFFRDPKYSNTEDPSPVDIAEFTDEAIDALTNGFPVFGESGTVVRREKFSRSAAEKFWGRWNWGA